MAKIESNYVTGRLPAPIPAGVEITSVKTAIALTAAQAQAANVLHFIVLPADCVIVDYILNSSDLDTGVTAVLGLGVLADDGLTIASSLLSGSTIGQAGGIATGRDSKAAQDAIGAIAATHLDRKIGVTNNAIVGGQIGSITLEVFYKSA